VAETLKKGTRVTGAERETRQRSQEALYGGREHPCSRGFDRPLVRLHPPHPQRVRRDAPGTRRGHPRQVEAAAAAL